MNAYMRSFAQKSSLIAWISPRSNASLTQWSVDLANSHISVRKGQRPCSDETSLAYNYSCHTVCRLTLNSRLQNLQVVTDIFSNFF
jgi:hypothetical protein